MTDLLAFNGQFFNPVNPGIERYQSRDYGIGKFGQDSGSRDCNPLVVPIQVRGHNKK